MTAGIEEGVDTPVHVAIEDELSIHDEADDEVALVRHLAVVAEHDPRLAQDASLLLLENLRAGVGGAMNQKAPALTIQPQVT